MNEKIAKIETEIEAIILALNYRADLDGYKPGTTPPVLDLDKNFSGDQVQFNIIVVFQENPTERI
jgi:hypothetical protein